MPIISKYGNHVHDIINIPRRIKKFPRYKGLRTYAYGPRSNKRDAPTLRVRVAGEACATEIKRNNSPSNTIKKPIDIIRATIPFCEGKGVHILYESGIAKIAITTGIGENPLILKKSCPIFITNISPQ